MDFLFLFLFCSSRLSNQLSKLYTQMTVGDLKKKRTTDTFTRTQTDNMHFFVCVFFVLLLLF